MYLHHLLKAAAGHRDPFFRILSMNLSYKGWACEGGAESENEGPSSFPAIPQEGELGDHQYGPPVSVTERLNFSPWSGKIRR